MRIDLKLLCFVSFAACSTVLVPARVVQALNLNLDEMGSAQPRFQGGFSLSCQLLPYPSFDFTFPIYQMGFHEKFEYQTKNLFGAGASMTPRSNSNALLSQQMLCIEPHRPSTATNYEVRLPQEWTY